MATTINAVTSAGGGLAVTGDSSGVLGFQSAGTTYMTMDASGNLNFAGTGQRITGDFSNATVANRVMFQTSTTNSNTIVAVIPNGTAQQGNFTAYNNSDPTNASTLAVFVGGAGFAAIQSSITGTGTYLPLVFQTGGSERMRIDTSGNVLVGTSGSAGAKLHVVSSTNSNTIGLYAGPSYAVRIGGTSSTGIIEGVDPTGVTSYQPMTVGGSTVLFTTSGTERMRIDSSGNVGIGASSPIAKLDIAGSIYQSGSWATIGSHNANGSYPPINAVSLQTAWNFTSGGREVDLMNGDTGATGGSGGFIFWQRTGASTSTRILGITGNGVYANTTASAANVYVDSNNTLARSTSALKYKQNVRDLPSIDINKFRPVVYNSKCEGDDQTIDYFGIIADEVDEAGIKELVTYGSEGEVEGFQYERLTVVLLKAIQEQQVQIAEQSATIKQLQADVAALQGAK